MYGMSYISIGYQTWCVRAYFFFLGQGTCSGAKKYYPDCQIHVKFKSKKVKNSWNQLAMYILIKKNNFELETD